MLGESTMGRERERGTNGVLVDRTGDQARDIGLVSEDVGERVGERRGSLDSGEMGLSDVVPVFSRECVSLEGKGKEREKETNESVNPKVALDWL